MKIRWDRVLVSLFVVIWSVGWIWFLSFYSPSIGIAIIGATIISAFFILVGFAACGWFLWVTDQ